MDAPLQIKINTDSTRIPLVRNIRRCTGVVRVAGYTRFAFYTHTWIMILPTHTSKIEGQSRSRSLEERRASANSTRLWPGSCCIGYIMNAQLKIVGYIASLYAHYRVPKIRKLVSRASHFIFANKSLPRATSGCATIIRSLPLCSIISDRLPSHFVFSFPPSNRCTIDSIWKFRSPMMPIVQSDARQFFYYAAYS